MTRFGTKTHDPIINRQHIIVDLLPYLKLDTSLIGKQNPWENTLIGGAGIRFMPALKWTAADKGKQITFRFFAAWLSGFAYYKKKPPVWTPNHNYRIGLIVSYGLY